MDKNIERLKKLNNFGVVHSSKYFQKHFVERYFMDIPRMAFELFGISLTYQQVDVVNEHYYNQGRLVVPSGHGCHGIDTPIMLSDGMSKKVQHIKVGDKLMGDDGKSERTVLSLARGREEMYEFVFNDGTKRIYNKSHILSLVASQTHGTQTKGDKVNIRVSEWLKWSDRKKRTHCIEKSPICFNDNYTLLIEPYMLGLWLGDGTSAKSAITNIDEEVVKFIYDYAKETNHSIVVTDSNGTRTPTYNIKHKHRESSMQQKLKELGLINNKHIPHCYLLSSIEQRRELLAGLLDTDGSLDRRNLRIFEITQKGLSLSLDIVSLARSCGHHATIREVEKSCIYKRKKRTGTYYTITISRFTEKIPTRITRKKAKLSGKEQRQHLKFGIKSVNPIGVDNYYGFELDGNHKFLDGDFIITHNTGKTANIGIITACFMLLFPYSITRIQAPTEAQITNFSFKEIENCFVLLSSYKRIDGKLTRSRWYWLARFFQFNVKKVFVKGFSRNWYCEAKTAPKGKSESLSGQHKWAYQLIIDEASGVEDDHINASMGALSNYFNSAILFSQHTKLTGLFNDFVTVQNKENGGLWSCVRLNSEQSPIVDIKSIKNWRETYNESQYAVRVNGLPPLYVEGNLISPTEALNAFSTKGKGWIDTIKFNTLVVSADTANRGVRDSSVVTVAMVAKVGDTIYVVVLAILVFHGKTAKMPTETAEEVIKAFLKYEQLGLKDTILCYDASSGGAEGYTRLEKRFGLAPINENDEVEKHLTVIDRDNLQVVPIVWGADRITGAEKKLYRNARAKAFGGLQKGCMETKEHLYIKDQRYKTRTVRELSNIPFKHNDKMQLQIAAKEDFEIGSPDIADTLAQIYLLNYNEVEVEEVIIKDDVNEEIEMNLGIKEPKDSLDIEDFYSHVLGR